MYSRTIEKIIEIFSKFPTVGPKTAARFVFYLLKIPKEKAIEFAHAIKELRDKIKVCPLCFSFFEPKTEEQKLCFLCSNSGRDRTTICIVEKGIDRETIEKIKKYKGLYFVLEKTIPILKNEKTEKFLEERIEELVKRIKSDSQIKEIILALNATLEGEKTCLWLERKLKALKIKTTRLGRGLPIGGELEYADEETLFSAFENRK